MLCKMQYVLRFSMLPGPARSGGGGEEPAQSTRIYRGPRAAESDWLLCRACPALPCPACGRFPMPSRSYSKGIFSLHTFPHMHSHPSGMREITPHPLTCLLLLPLGELSRARDGPGNPLGEGGEVR